MTILPLNEPFFRHEYGRLVAMLSRRAGIQNLELVEDAVQSALLAAVATWPRGSVPDNPSAWLFRVAYNHVVGELRRRGRSDRLAARHGDRSEAVEAAPAAVLAGDVRDDILRMLFVCCDDSLPVESQLVIALTTLCGFGVHEVAERLFISEANVYKRLGRARSRLRTLPFEPDELSPQQLASRLPAVGSILYVLFTEGYLSSHVDGPIRTELCEEAKRLAHVLAEHPVSAAPETFALIALMHLHGARIAGPEWWVASSAGARALLRLGRGGQRSEAVGSPASGRRVPRRLPARWPRHMLGHAAARSPLKISPLSHRSTRTDGSPAVNVHTEQQDAVVTVANAAPRIWTAWAEPAPRWRGSRGPRKPRSAAAAPPGIGELSDGS